MLNRVYSAHFQSENPSHYSPNQIKIHFLSKTFSFFIFEFSLKNLQRIRATVPWFTIHQHSWNFCKHQIMTVKQGMALLHWSFIHGSFVFELIRASWASSLASIHQYQPPCASVSTFQGQITSVSSLHLQQGWFSTLLFFEIMMCFRKVLPCWVHWML